MSVQNAVESLIEKSKTAIPTNDCDYIGEDGLLYCGKCHTKKQTEVMLFGTIRRPMCLCKCEAEKRDKEEAERKQADFGRKIKDLRRTGFPESNMQEWTFENDDMTNSRVTNAMKKYVENFDEMKKQGKGLLLYGNVGTGKTYAACEVANALIDKGYPVLVTNFARIINALQATFEKQEYIDSFNRFSLLVIDDLGIERNTEFAKEQVFNIIDSRYRAGLPMIITTNLSIDKIKKPDDIENGRIYDRILERCFPIEVSGQSRRRKAIKESYDDMKNLLEL
jgi:DNA replication protein DnaC|nr:MAG TPA: Replicative helicase [Caudoviricetes sp.]